MELSKQQKIRYARIIYNSDGKQTREIDNMTVQELQKIRSVYAQKIAYQAVNGHIEAFGDAADNLSARRPTIPNLLTSLCCCIYPEYNQDYFDVTTSIFLKRVFNPFLFWNNHFFDINNGKSQQYGNLWMILTYSIVLGFAANLNKFFMEPVNFTIENELLMTALGISIVFFVSEPLIYAAVVSCLGGYIANNQSMMLSSYSLVLYLLPTMFCLIPSLYWHVTMIAGGCLFRTFFLYRNYAIKLETKTYILLLVIIIVKSLFFFIVLKVMFPVDAGYSYTSGFNAVFGQTPTIQTTTTTASTASKKAQHLVYTMLRHFQY